MDTQGHDLSIVKGGSDYISQFVGLQSELSFTKLYEDQICFEETLKYYQHKGFKLSALVPNNAGVFPDLLETDCIMYNSLFSRQM
jgi:hypothetical protein